MRTEGAVFPREAETGQSLLDLLVDLLDLTPALVHANPDYIHAA